MSKWRVLINKELKHLFRDTKTIVQTVVVPTFITPVLIGAIFWYISSIAQEETVKTYDIAYSGDISNQIYDEIEETDRFTIVPIDSLENLKLSVQDDSSDIGIYIDDEFNLEPSINSTVKVMVFYKDLDTFSQAKDILMNIINDYEKDIISTRLNDLNIDENILDPIDLEEEDLTTDKEFAGTFIGALIAFLFIAYILQGSMYPAIEMGAGEKERGTMETLISTNISSVEIIIGKMFSITLSAVITAIFSTLGFILPLIVVFLYFGDSIPDTFFNIVSAIVNPLAILGIFSMLVPLSIFMGALMLAVSVYSKNPKEAGLLLGNLMIFFFAPAYLPLINPGLEIDLVGSLIPCFSLALHTNALISDNLDPFLFSVTIFSTIVYSLISIYVTYIMFDDEKVIFRT
ncbi:MAG: ABC transporter permease [Gammaproteobacteria bacterium]|uniref:ABC transporter permease n=1 Tax=SAR86 cluster bacterium TaxID=2030880 RepID=A0A520N0G2_9GAMM|nr:ABC transporter permease [SAR86 cluster bacterium]RZO26916.1 MAG: ABC transporter permease [SAR86 cluster bacterium]|tara:strand:- start:405 stop:1613 length:1209 start_codon:yes stop_codon:yes gene_type:complete